MINKEEKYGNINLKGKDINVDATSSEELKKYLEELNETHTKILEEQNEYLSQILK